MAGERDARPAATSGRQWLGFVLLVVVIVLAVAGAVVLLLDGLRGCACTTAPDAALSVVGGLW